MRIRAVLMVAACGLLLPAAITHDPVHAQIILDGSSVTQGFMVGDRQIVMKGVIAGGGMRVVRELSVTDARYSYVIKKDDDGDTTISLSPPLASRGSILAGAVTFSVPAKLAVSGKSPDDSEFTALEIVTQRVLKGSVLVDRKKNRYRVGDDFALSRLASRGK